MAVTLRLVVLFVALALGVVACGSPATATPTSTSTPSLSASDVQNLARDALADIDAMRVDGTFHLMIEGEPDQDGSYLFEWTPNASRMVTEASAGSEGYNELICVGGVTVSRDEKDGEWHRQPSSIGQATCTAQEQGVGGIFGGEASNLTESERDGKDVWILTLEREQDFHPTPQPGTSSITSISWRAEVVLDKESNLPISVTWHQEMPITQWTEAADGSLQSSVRQQSSDQTNNYEYVPVDVRLPAGF